MIYLVLFNFTLVNIKKTPLIFYDSYEIKVKDDCIRNEQFACFQHFLLFILSKTNLHNEIFNKSSLDSVVADLF